MQIALNLPGSRVVTKTVAASSVTVRGLGVTTIVLAARVEYTTDGGPCVLSVTVPKAEVVIYTVVETVAVIVRCKFRLYVLANQRSSNHQR